MATEQTDQRIPVRREISRRMVALFKSHVGRGPTSARTILTDRLVLVVLEDTLTRAERVLASQEKVGLVRQMRDALISSMRTEIAELVSEQTGRDVVAVCSDHEIDPDFAMVAAILDPESGTKPEAGGVSEELGLSRAEARNGQRTISRSMVRLLKDFVGRGPTDARTYIDQDVVVVLLGDTLTKAERTLAERNRPTDVRELRREFQEAMQDEIVAITREATGRTVVGFLSDHSVFPDYAVEVLVLEPEKVDGPA